MLTIRLQRVGTKNRPAYRMVLAERQRAVGKKFQEILGHYNPANKVFGVKDEERLKYWLSQNVHLSPTVHNLLVKNELLDKPKVKAWSPKKKKQAKTEGTEEKKEDSAASAPEAKAAEKPVEGKVKTEEAVKETKPEQAEVKSAVSDAEASLAPKGREPKAEATPADGAKAE